MEGLIKASLKDLLLSIKKDILFFGSCGTLVGFFMANSDKFGRFSEALTDSLWGDFVSIYLYFLLYYSLLILSTFDAILRRLNCKSVTLASVIIHLKGRLTSVTSGLISFFLGLLITAILSATKMSTLTAIAIVLLSSLLTIGYATAMTIVPNLIE